MTVINYAALNLLHPTLYPLSYHLLSNVGDVCVCDWVQWLMQWLRIASNYSDLVGAVTFYGGVSMGNFVSCVGKKVNTIVSYYLYLMNE